MLKVTAMGQPMTIKNGMQYYELAHLLRDKLPYQPMAAIQGNRMMELISKVSAGGDIRFIDIRNQEGMRIYHRSLLIIMMKAVKEILGIKARVIVEHSIYRSLYCEIREIEYEITDDFLADLTERMKELIRRDIPILKSRQKRKQAVKLMRELGLEDKVELMRYRSASDINLYDLEGYSDYFYGYMTPSTGYLDIFELKKYKNGFLIVMPDAKKPAQLLQFQDSEKLSNVFMEQMHWSELMGVSNIAKLNGIIVEGAFGDLVRINEALHEKKIAEIADQIAKRKDDVKVVLIAGPSSSGKTTFAHRLCIQLRVNGIIPHTISMDNYFIDRDKTPLDEYGKHDFENIDALDVALFNHDLLRLIHGERVELPRYNFVTGKREFKGEYKELKPGEIFVIEGIHGLNDALTKYIPTENKFKIFISAMMQLNIDDHNRISTTDSRLIRRIVRDHQFRGTDAAGTISAWDYVTRGEEKNIFPFQESADVIFNSSTIYELSVLKPYIYPILYKIDETMPEYITAMRIIKFMDYFIGVNSDVVPSNAILKEFLGGSCFHV